MDRLRNIDQFFPTSLRIVVATGLFAVSCTRSQNTGVVPTEVTPLPTASATYGPEYVATEVATGTTTATSIPTSTEAPLPTASATVVPDLWDSKPWTGELPFNNLYKKYTAAEIWDRVLGYEAAQFPKWDISGRIDSFQTSLINPWNSTEFNTNPLKESGLEYKSGDTSLYYISVTDILSQTDLLVTDLGHYNGYTDNFTTIVTGEARNRDAVSLVMAVQILAAERPELFIKQGKFISLDEAMNDQKLQSLLLDIQDQIFDQVQKGFLPVTKREIDRRNDSSSGDASGIIPELFRRSNQSVSCDVYRDGDEQKLREVYYVEDGDQTFTEARDTDQIGFFARFNPETGKWDVDEFTVRYYEGEDSEQIYAAVGQERLNCGPQIVRLSASPTRRVVIQYPEQTPAPKQTSVAVTPLSDETPPENTPPTPPTSTPQSSSSPTPPGATPQELEATVTPGQPSVDSTPVQPPPPAETPAPPVESATSVPQPTPGSNPTPAVPN